MESIDENGDTVLPSIEGPSAAYASSMSRCNPFDHERLRMGPPVNEDGYAPYNRQQVREPVIIDLTDSTEQPSKRRRVENSGAVAEDRHYATNSRQVDYHFAAQPTMGTARRLVDLSEPANSPRLRSAYGQIQDRPMATLPRGDVSASSHPHLVGLDDHIQLNGAPARELPDNAVLHRQRHQSHREYAPIQGEPSYQRVVMREELPREPVLVDSSDYDKVSRRVAHDEVRSSDNIAVRYTPSTSTYSREVDGQGHLYARPSTQFAPERAIGHAQVRPEREYVPIYDDVHPYPVYTSRGPDHSLQPAPMRRPIVENIYESHTPMERR